MINYGIAIPLALLLCLGVPSAPRARAQGSPSPLNPGFNGFNHNPGNAVEYFDSNFQHVLTTLRPVGRAFQAVPSPSIRLGVGGNCARVGGPSGGETIHT